jgi:hypothetical protein
LCLKRLKNEFCEATSGFARELWRERERFLPFAREKLKVKNTF